jgi:hypothetical protein
MMDLSFPIKERLPADTFSGLLRAASFINKNQFEQGLADLGGLRDTLSAADNSQFIGYSILQHRINSANY